ncbi:hypothetical protein WMY93_014953 [Mugilogobius chulae]|uniref:Branchpoint-bridging protein n=1 Tax=Mugilogobius chulae TaxID=88201 RepID=A0AAW0NWU3_9GOBI
MATGANATPLGKLHPSIGAKRGFDAGPGSGNGLMPTPGPPGAFPAMPGFQPPMPSQPFPQFNPGPGFPQPPQGPPGGGMAKQDFGNKKRKRSRWSSETPDQKTIIPGMPTVIPPGLTREQERAYIVQLQIEDLTRKLRTGDLGIPVNPEDRSPSPEPIYNSEGKRLNTENIAHARRLRRSKECCAKIMIRGKGSVKEGKVGRKDGQMLPGEDEPLHALVTANTMENIRNILKQGIETPEDQNDLRKMQLRELARLNGTLREDDNRILRPWQNAEPRSITNTTLCTKCGGAGHISSDCKYSSNFAAHRAAGGEPPQSAQDKARMDKEYLSLMAELGEAPVPSSGGHASPQGNRPPWMNSGPGENRNFHGMPGGPGGPHNFPPPMSNMGGPPMPPNPNGMPPPWMQPPPPPMGHGPGPHGHPMGLLPPPMGMMHLHLLPWQSAASPSGPLPRGSSKLRPLLPQAAWRPAQCPGNRIPPPHPVLAPAVCRPGNSRSSLQPLEPSSAPMGSTSMVLLPLEFSLHCPLVLPSSPSTPPGSSGMMYALTTASTHGP